MTREKELFVRLLRAFVQGEKISDAGVSYDDWTRVYALASIHAVTGLVAYMFVTSDQSNLDEESKKLMDPMRKSLLETVAIYCSRADLMDKLMVQMNKEGIDHLLIKGFLIRDLYPLPELRTFGDIDFLIRPQDVNVKHFFTR